jgi:VirE N-terminal domain
MSSLLRLLADAPLSLFRNSFNSTPLKIIPLQHMLEAILTGRYQSQVDQLRRILAREGKRAYDHAKAYLPAVTFGGTFAPSRRTAYLQQHSGVVHVDLDKLSDLTATKRAYCSDPRTCYCFTSPSWIGLKAGIYIGIVADVAAYKHAWHTVRKEYEARYGVPWDPSGKDVSRLCFMSYDPELYWNPEAICFDVPLPAVPGVRSAATPLSRAQTSIAHRDRQDYAAQAISIATRMIQSAPLGLRHHARLKASRLLGGYIAGGLMTEDQAYGALAQALVGHTEDRERALKTVEDGLAYGQANPITLDALATDREEWIRQHRNTHSGQQWMSPDDLWEGTNTLLIKPYVGYRGLRSRIQGKGATRGHSR